MIARQTWLAAALLATIAACSRGSEAPVVPSPQPTATPRIVALGDGVVLDRATGLEWTSRDHERSLPWDEADRWCRERPRGDGSAWRLPEIGELESLYEVRFDEPCGDRRCHVDPAIRLGGPYIWSVSERGAGTRFYYDFSAGYGYSPFVTPMLVRRTLCVRATK